MEEELRALRAGILFAITVSEREVEALSGLKDHHEKMIISLGRTNDNAQWMASAYHALLKVNVAILNQTNFQNNAKEDIAIIDKELED